MLERRALTVGVCVEEGVSEKNPTTTRILLGALIPQNLKHINFSRQNSEKAVNGAQIPAKWRRLKRFTLRGGRKVLKHGSNAEKAFTRSRRPLCWDLDRIPLWFFFCA